MKYVAIDIETTGLNPSKDQILQIAAIKGDTRSDNVDDSWVRRIHWDRITGDPRALAMNTGLIKGMGNGTIPLHVALVELKEWLGKDKVTWAGKNVGSFDLQFLKKHLDAVGIEYRHRILDVGPLFLSHDDVTVPDLMTCCERAAVFYDFTRAHKALYDCSLVVRCIYKYFEKLESR